MEKTSFVLRGNICYSETKDKLSIMDRGYLVCEQGISQGVFPELPERFLGLPIEDYGNLLIIPGLTDLHLHGPQYSFRGLGMDLELLDWLDTYTFPEESRYQDLDYARKAYSSFADDLRTSATTRAVVFGTVHGEATKLLMDALEETGLETYVGKVNMDQNCGDSLREKGAKASLEATRLWLEAIQGRYQRTRPILTPRFAPTCSEALLDGLGRLQQEQGLPVQSHLSENLSEIAWVKELFPWSSCYGEVYQHFGLFGGKAKTVMAHCVHSSQEEVNRMREMGVYVAHCPQSNMNLSSGIAPVRSYLQQGLLVGLGTDIAGGASLSMFRCMADAVNVSKLYWRLVDQEKKPLTMEEVFYLATVGGGSFFGKVGSFAEGFSLDALVLDDRGIAGSGNLSTRERVERYVYLAEEKGRLEAKYVAGGKVALNAETGCIFPGKPL